MIATGELTLSEFLDTIKPFLNTTIESKHKQKFLLTEKLKEEAYIHLIKKPIIIYVRHETLASNNATLSLGLIVDKIIDIEKIETLLFLSSLGDSKPEDEKIHWIAFEINIEDAKSTINLCDNCIYEFAECDGNPKFGTGFGNDNVYECDKFILSNI